MKLDYLKFAAWLIGVTVVAPVVLAQAKPPTIADQSGSKPFFFESVLDKYRPYKEQDIQSWVQANNTVGMRGGWRQYLKESQAARSQP